MRAQDDRAARNDERAIRDERRVTAIVVGFERVNSNAAIVQRSRQHFVLLLRPLDERARLAVKRHHLIERRAGSDEDCIAERRVCRAHERRGDDILFRHRPLIRSGSRPVLPYTA